MAYLTENDYLPQLRTEMRTRITEADAAVLAGAEFEVQALVESYLRGRYDMAAEWALTAAARNGALVRAMIDIVIYDIYSRVAPGQIPVHRQSRYDNALRWLEMVADGKLSLPMAKLLPTDDTTPPTGGMMIGSETRFNT